MSSQTSQTQQQAAAVSAASEPKRSKVHIGENRNKKKKRPQTYADCQQCGERFGPLLRLSTRFCSYVCSVAQLSGGTYDLRHKTYQKGYLRCPACDKYLHPEYDKDQIKVSKQGYRFHIRRLCPGTQYGRLRSKTQGIVGRHARNSMATYY